MGLYREAPSQGPQYQIHIEAQQVAQATDPVQTSRRLYSSSTQGAYAEIAENHSLKRDAGFGALTGAFIGFAATGGNPIGGAVGAAAGGLIGLGVSVLSLRDTEKKAGIR